MLEKTSGKVVILASQVSDDSPKAPGSIVNYANDLDIADNGTVYFTTSSDIPVVPNKLGFWDTFAVFSLTMLQVQFPRSVQSLRSQILQLIHKWSEPKAGLQVMHAWVYDCCASVQAIFKSRCQDYSAWLDL